MASPYGPWAWTDPFMRPVVHDLILLLLVLTALLLAVSAADVSCFGQFYLPWSRRMARRT